MSEGKLGATSPRFEAGDTAGLTEAAEEVGYPLLVKAAAGGGGIGMRRVDDAARLQAAVEATCSMAARAFGDSTVFLERFVRRARHVEVQVFGGGDGHVVHFHDRDCSLQRRFQKIIEEAPAPQISAAVREKMYKAALSLAHQQRYRSAGTVEFILDAESEEFYFLEMNTRIQVEHPVSEEITGSDLISLQLRLAAGEPSRDVLPSAVPRIGHAIECRLYAENPDKNFLPSPGTLGMLDLPTGVDGVRIDIGVAAGDKITAYYDPMIAKVIGWGADRETAIERVRNALKVIRIEGIKTNRAFLIATLDHPAFRKGDIGTDFIDTYRDALLGK